MARLKESTRATSSESGFPAFLFAYSDVCPSTGCLAGCSEGLRDEGNGYFGIFHTQEYLTEGLLSRSSSRLRRFVRRRYIMALRKIKDTTIEMRFARAALSR